MRHRSLTVAAAALALATVPATAAGAHEGHDDAIAPVNAEDLSGPRQVSGFGHDRLVVAESDSGEVSSVDLDTGKVHTLLSGLAVPQGVDYDDGMLYVALGSAPPPGEDTGGETFPPDAVFSSLLVATPDGTVRKTIDLLAYELANNPDGQPQFAEDGTPYDALSNPYAVWADDHRVLVADGGANDVLSVDPWTGQISTFFVPPTVKGDEVAACGAPDAQANPGVEGCDPVPTGVAEGPDGRIYVSTLGAEAPGAAKVYVLSPDGKKVLRVIDDLTGVAGLAVDEDGTVYVSELTEGAPEGAPGPDFDPATVGQVVRIECDGERSASQVTMPTGLTIKHDHLYASAWSIASQIPGGHPGEVDRVGEGSFQPLT